jgi:hypothetical protein
MDLSVKRIRQFELFTCVGIAHADFVGGYDEVKRCYVADTGRSFEEDLELSDKYWETHGSETISTNRAKGN